MNAAILVPIEIKHMFKLTHSGMAMYDSACMYFNDYTDEELYKIFQNIIEAELPFIYVYSNDFSSYLYRFHGDNDENYNNLDFSKIDFNENEKQIIKYYEMLKLI